MTSMALWGGLLWAALAAAGNGSAPEPVSFSTDSFLLAVGADGRALSLQDRATGTEYCDATAGAPFAYVRTGAGAFPAAAARRDGADLVLEFPDAGASVRLEVTAAAQRLEFGIKEVRGEGIEELTFVCVPLTLRGDLSEPFGVSPLALNLQTLCPSIPGLSPGLPGFTAYKRFGVVGAKGAVVAAPVSELRDALKDAVESAPDLVASPLGGPWALDAAINQGSYLIDTAGITEENVHDWIDAARRVGATQIDLHGGHAFRWGDYEVNREVYPRGRESLKAVVDAIHDAGMAAGLHTYAFFISKETPWVTPVPDPRLDKAATFTLAADLSEADTHIAVEESTESVSPVTGFHVRNSVTLQIDDELITFTGVNREPPYGFTGCVRGALGTRAAPHAKGAPVHQLKECFGLFSPQGDSTLFAEVAQRTADLYNACGFDMLYLDALDGSDVPAGGPYAWHYAAKFAFELARRLDKPAVMEMSTFNHHLWCVRSRMEAWDVPSRAVKDFVDGHVWANRRWQNAFLPTHLGWWGAFDGGALHPERTFPDDVEYVCAKALATNSSLSYLVGFGPDSLARDHARRLAALTKRYEDLRRANAVPESIKERLAAPGADFTLETDPDGGWKFRPARYAKHKVELKDSPQRFTTDNPYASQPLQVRIEALLAPDSDAADGDTLASFDNAAEFGPGETQAGVTAELETGAGEGAVLTARNGDVEPDRAWAAFTKEFTPPVDLANKGLGLWVEGDGQGAVLNVQVRSPRHLSGGFADRYIPVDFTGRRYFELVEPESDDLARYEWAHTLRKVDWARQPAALMGYLYPMYHIWADYRQIATLTVGINNLPQGKSVEVRLGPVRALPLRSVKLVNPAVRINGRTLTFPVELENGSYLEFRGLDDCRAYDAQGASLGEVVPVGEVPILDAGVNTVDFIAAPSTEGTARARVTVITLGEPLQP